ncbi:MAG: DUF6378 domain-containing protein [Candidatus Thorarchaeota archaeon]|jgi:hypothetical protein
MERGDILDGAKDLICGDRNRQYGEPGPQLGLAGKLYRLWYEAGGHKYSDAHCEAVHQIFTKLSRLAFGEVGKLDTYMDLVGYAAIAGQLATGQEEQDNDGTSTTDSSDNR